MPLASERELHYGCSSEGEGRSYRGQGGERKCLIAFGLTSNNIDLPSDTSQAVIFRSGIITSEQRQTAFSLSCVQTPMASEHCVLSLSCRSWSILVKHSSPSKLLQKGRFSSLRGMISVAWVFPCSLCTMFQGWDWASNALVCTASSAFHLIANTVSH